MRACLDASVLVSVVFADIGSDRLGAWLGDLEGPPLVSDFCRGELIAVVGRKVRSRELEHRAAAETIERVDAFLATWNRIAIHPDDVERAATLLRHFDLRLRLPDAIHLAIAERADATLVTTDHAQRDAARAVGISVHDPLEDRS